MKKMVSFRLSEEQIEKLDRISVELGISRTEFLVLMLDDFDKPGEASQDKGNNDIVSSLLCQLEEKDKQIAQLMEQARNFQILLKGEQDKVLLLSAPKRSFFQRLFGRRDPDPEDS